MSMAYCPCLIILDVSMLVHDLSMLECIMIVLDLSSTVYQSCYFMSRLAPFTPSWHSVVSAPVSDVVMGRVS